MAAMARPNTIASLSADLRALGVRPEETLLVHSSLSSLGWTCSGVHAVILALRESLGSARAPWSYPPTRATSPTPPSGATHGLPKAR